MSPCPFRRSPRCARRAAFALALSAIAGVAAAANHTVTAPALATGRFAVACSNVAQDPALIAQYGGTPPEDFWEGKPANGQLRYISQILASPQTAVVIAPFAPPTPEVYPQFAGQSVTHVAIVCFPTSRSNTDPDYVLPQTGDRVPRMQPAGTVPKLINIAEHASAYGIEFSPPPPNVPAKLPFIVFSHGLGGSPISPGYISALTELASQGYMTGAVFHGDARFSRIRLEDLGDFAFLLTQFDKFAEMQLMRPLSLKALTDHLLSRADYAAGIDPDRIGAFGTSMGGQSVANLMGARLTTSIGKACRETVRDPRIKAAVGYVPYAGQSFLPSFCDDQSGADDVTRPYLGIAGTADTTAPITLIRQAINRMGSSRYLVELQGVPHEYRDEYRGDVFTWTVNFLNTYLNASFDPGAINRLITQKDVAGGVPDTLSIDRHVPTVLNPGETLAVEFYNTILEHYFVTALPGEAAFVASGGAGPGWEATGFDFKAHPASELSTSPVCRFYGVPAGGPNSHFFTVNAGECEFVKSAGGWFYEGIGFHIRAPLADGSCPAGYLQVLRAYNQGFPTKDANHRYVTSDSEWRDMQRRGWALEGTVMCSLP